MKQEAKFEFDFSKIKDSKNYSRPSIKYPSDYTIQQRNEAYNEARNEDYNRLDAERREQFESLQNQLSDNQNLGFQL